MPVATPTVARGAGPRGDTVLRHIHSLPVDSVQQMCREGGGNDRTESDNTSRAGLIRESSLVTPSSARESCSAARAGPSAARVPFLAVSTAAEERAAASTAPREGRSEWWSQRRRQRGERRGQRRRRRRRGGEGGGESSEAAIVGSPDHPQSSRSRGAGHAGRTGRRRAGYDAATRVGRSDGPEHARADAVLRAGGAAT